jgi:hypothetical protein
MKDCREETKDVTIVSIAVIAVAAILGIIIIKGCDNTTQENIEAMKQGYIRSNYEWVLPAR